MDLLMVISIYNFRVLYSGSLLHCLAAGETKREGNYLTLSSKLNGGFPEVTCSIFCENYNMFTEYNELRKTANLFIWRNRKIL